MQLMKRVVGTVVLGFLWGGFVLVALLDPPPDWVRAWGFLSFFGTLFLVSGLWLWWGLFRWDQRPRPDSKEPPTS